MQQAADDFAETLDGINVDNFTPKGLHDAVVQAETVPTPAFTARSGRWKMWRARLMSGCRTSGRGCQPQRDLLGEIRAQAMWKRPSRVLDAADDGTVTAVAP
jgi:hypothetical protein